MSRVYAEFGQSSVWNDPEWQAKDPFLNARNKSSEDGEERSSGVCSKKIIIFVVLVCVGTVGVLLFLAHKHDLSFFNSRINGKNHLSLNMSGGEDGNGYGSASVEAAPAGPGEKQIMKLQEIAKKQRKTWFVKTATPTSVRKLEPPISQVHMALTEVSNSLVISWTTRDKKAPKRSIVKYGVTEHLTSMAVGSYRSYAGTNDTIHHVTLWDLQPRRVYYFQCGSPQSGWSETLQFVSPPAETSTHLPWSFVALADMGVTSAAGAVVEQLISEATKHDFVFHVGDLSYARGFDAVWDMWFDQIAPLTSFLPWMVAPGNHELLLADSGGEAGIPYTARFKMPESSGSPFWYSFNYRNVHFVSFSTDSDYYPHSQQYEWLKKDLQEANAPANRKIRPWIIVLGHKPMYCSFNWTGDHPDIHNTEITNMVKYLEPLFQSSNVDLVLGGHVHRYERSFPVGNNGTQISLNYHAPQLPVYLVLGVGGFGEMPFQWMKPSPPWSGFRGDTFGYVRLTYANATALHIQYISIAQDPHGASGAPHDDFWITK